MSDKEGRWAVARSKPWRAQRTRLCLAPVAGVKSPGVKGSEGSFSTASCSHPHSTLAKFHSDGRKRCCGTIAACSCHGYVVLVATYGSPETV
jgi:hypothetical protein